MPASHAKISVPDSGSCVLSLGGEFDLANAETIVELGIEGLSIAGVERLVVDLAAVTFMDSTALGALIRLRNLSQGRNQEMSLAGVPDRVQRLLAVTGLAEVFTAAIGSAGATTGGGVLPTPADQPLLPDSH
jgi:anti-sigma B factor antagonist